jgi:RNA polymerase sigma factor (sigma-70 family)
VSVITPVQDEARIARAELIACLHRVAAHDRDALAELYRRTAAKLFALCLRILGDRAEAEDVLQEVYVTVWNKAASFDAARGVSPITWLAAVTRNRALDRLRRRGRHFAGLDEAAEGRQRDHAPARGLPGGPGRTRRHRYPRRVLRRPDL